MYILDVFITCNNFNIATHSTFDAAHEASKMDIVSAVVCVYGTLRQTVTSSGAYLPRTPSCCETNPEINWLLMCTVIVCKMPCNQKYKKEAGVGPYLKKFGDRAGR